ncbi:MAG: hypothetical protein ACR2RA_19950 [Geminicoccaceae bacterium]
MGPLIGALMAGGASGLFGGAGGGGFLGGIMGKLLSGGGLGGLISNLFGGGQQSGASGAADQTNQLLGDIKNMLGQLLDQKGGGQGGCGGSSGSHGVNDGGCGMPSDGGHGCGSKPVDDHGCSGASKPSCGEPQHGCGDMGDDMGHCDSKPSHDCGEAGDTGWDGEDKSPSLDRERGAARLLEQAKNTDDPEQKRELIDMALDMLGDGPKGDGLFGKIMQQRDGNSYDKDMVDQAKNMLDQIDDGNLDCCNKSKALDSVIDMLMDEGGVDGKPAGNDGNGNGMRDIGDLVGDRPMPFHHHSLHDVLFHRH